MPNIFRITLAAAAICAVPMATIAIAADHREAPMIEEDITADIADIYSGLGSIAPSEHDAINTWRRTRQQIRPRPFVPVPSRQGSANMVRPR